MSRIVVTGMGVISAIGNDVRTNLESLRLGRTGIGSLEFYPTAFAGRLPCGEIKISTEALALRAGAARVPGITRTSILAWLAFQEAIGQAGIGEAELASTDTALVGATTVGGMCMTDELYSDANAIGPPSPYAGSYDYGSVAISIQKRYGMAGIVDTINTACSSSANAILYGARLIRHGLARRAIVGGADSLAKFTINGFNALHILSPELCRPFDAGRRGLNLGEASAFLVLEREEDASGKPVLAALSGFGNTNDAFHPSSTSDNGEGPFLAMQSALAAAGLATDAIGYINAHGTGTENNDITESHALLRLFGNNVPPFSSTKSFTGHTLGAAGAIEAVFSILSLQHQEAYPSLHFADAIPETLLRPVQTPTPMRIEHVMSNSFGFGGNCTALIFSRA